MRVAVFSDSHRMMQNMTDAVISVNPDQIIHLGDCVSDAHELSVLFFPKETICVSGNNDFMSTEPSFRIIEICGTRIFITHGHKYGVKYGLSALQNEARTAGCGIALFGHTHKAQSREEGGVLLLNPGSIGYSDPTFAVLHFFPGGYNYKIISV